MNIREEKGVAGFLFRHAESKPVSFHMPGHKGSRFFKKNGYGSLMKNIADYDITEIPGADNLFQMESIIKETAEEYARLYNVKKSYPLINGTSGGLIASILATVPKGGKLIMARNCHKSVFNAVELGEITPIYAYPNIVKEYGIAGEVTVEEIEKLLRLNPEAYGVLVTSPNYYGICSDIRKIAELVHQHGKTLIVDQAHGAHLKFFGKNMPESAEEAGADLIVNSIHKTLGSFTQSAVLNVNGNVDTEVLENKLQMIESSSPSYLLMASLDANAKILRERGRKLIRQWRNDLKWFYKKVKEIPEVKVMDVDMDKTKINIDMGAFGIDGNSLEKMLNEYGIFPELSTGNLLMCMSGIGNTKKDYQRLYEALAEIAYKNRYKLVDHLKNQKEDAIESLSTWSRTRKLHGIPREKEWLPIEQCGGKVCAQSIIPYPPGIPLICPGEEILADDIVYVLKLKKRGEKVIGVSDDIQIQVGK